MICFDFSIFIRFRFIGEVSAFAEIKRVRKLQLLLLPQLRHNNAYCILISILFFLAGGGIKLQLPYFKLYHIFHVFQPSNKKDKNFHFHFLLLDTRVGKASNKNQILFKANICVPTKLVLNVLYLPNYFFHLCQTGYLYLTLKLPHSCVSFNGNVIWIFIL